MARKSGGGPSLLEAAKKRAAVLEKRNELLTAALEAAGVAGDVEGVRFTVEAVKRLEERNEALSNALREALEMLVANAWSPRAYQRLQDLLK